MREVTLKRLLIGPLAEPDRIALLSIWFRTTTTPATRSSCRGSTASMRRSCGCPTGRSRGASNFERCAGRGARFTG